MEPITYKNLLQFPEQFPEEHAKNTFEKLLQWNYFYKATNATAHLLKKDLGNYERLRIF